MASRSQNQVRWVAAGAVLLAAGAYAGTVVARPATYAGPDPGQIRELAVRLEGESPAAAVSLGVPPAPVPAPDSEPPRPAPRPAVRRPARVPGPRVGQLPVLPPAGTAAELEPAPMPQAAPVSPVKSIALMGVTRQDAGETAWLVNVDTRERELAAEGESAFGLTVKEIGPESVRVAHDGQEYTLALGEKQIPMVEAPPPAAAAAPGSGGMGWGGRRGNRGQGVAQGGGRGGFSGRGGRNGGNRGSAMTFGAGGMAGSANSSSGSFGGRGTGSNSFGGRQGGFGGRQGRFSGGFGGFAGTGQQNAGSTSQFAAGATGSTSNPQTARRQGGQRGGQGTADVPAIVNPQTQRRTGTTSGPAFGEAQQGMQGRAAGGAGGRTSR